MVSFGQIFNGDFVFWPCVFFSIIFHIVIASFVFAYYVLESHFPCRRQWDIVIASITSCCFSCFEAYLYHFVVEPIFQAAITWRHCNRIVFIYWIMSVLLADPGPAGNGAADSRLLCGAGEETFAGEVTCARWFPSAQAQQITWNHTGNTAAARGGGVTPRDPLSQRGRWELLHSWISFWYLPGVV